MDKKRRQAVAKAKSGEAGKGREVKTSPAKAAEPKASTSTMPPLPKMPSSARARKAKPLNPCTCGCGAQTTSMWAPGHDARARGWAIRIERDICKMKDVPENEQPGAKFMLKLRKELAEGGGGDQKGKLRVASRGGKKVEPTAPAATEPAATADEPIENEPFGEVANS